MDYTTIAVVIITGLFSVVTTILTSNKSDAIQGEQIKQIKEEIGTLSKKVEAHNNYGLEIVDLKARVQALEKRT